MKKKKREKLDVHNEGVFTAVTALVVCTVYA